MKHLKRLPKKLAYACMNIVIHHASFFLWNFLMSAPHCIRSLFIAAQTETCCFVPLYLQASLISASQGTLESSLSLVCCVYQIWKWGYDKGYNYKACSTHSMQNKPVPFISKAATLSMPHNKKKYIYIISSAFNCLQFKYLIAKSNLHKNTKYFFFNWADLHWHMSLHFLNVL